VSNTALRELGDERLLHVALGGRPGIWVAGSSAILAPVSWASQISP
jgi:hypothetical protein